MTAEQFSSVTSVVSDGGADKLTIKSGDASDEIDLSVVETTSENVVFTGAGDDTVTASGGVDKIVLESVFDGADTINDFDKASDKLYIDLAKGDAGSGLTGDNKVGTKLLSGTGTTIKIKLFSGSKSIKATKTNAISSKTL